MSGDCPVCGHGLAEAFRATVLSRHEAIYDHCSDCGFLRARAPHWIEEAYSDSIALTDTGLMLRNLVIARQLTAVLTLLGDKGDATYVDFAGGYGVLTRMMRDAGFDFYWSDKFSRNLLAKGFEYSESVGLCRAVTAFEVLEHVEDPRAFVDEAMAFAKSDILIFSTELYVGQPPKPEDWWYYSFETGQHIAFYRRDTLERLALANGLHFHSHRGLHFLSRSPLPRRRINFALGRLNRLLAFTAQRLRTTKTMTDHDLMVARLARENGTDARNI